MAITDSTETVASPAPHAARQQASIRHQPGLDGLRGLALLPMLFFHGGFPWAKGGFLALPMFFVLSGFLITTLLLVELEQKGRIALGAFWLRRLRRLAPAALITLGVIVVYGAVAATPSQQAAFAGDLRSAVLYVANWRMIGAGHSYAALFTTPSPVQHFWSLGVEEQFYLLFPLLVAGVFVLGKGSRRVFATTLGALFVASLGAQLLASNHDRIYYGTDTRASEFVAGALLALLMSRNRSAVDPSSGRRHPGLVNLLGIVGGVALLWAIAEVALGDGWLYDGGFSLIALPSAALVAATVVPGPVRSFMSLAPFRAIGVVSYGMYLYHWPIFLWLSEQRTGLPRGQLFVVRMAVTTAAAVASYVLVEQPIRTRRALKATKVFSPTLLAGGAAIVLAAIVFVPAPDSSRVIDASDFAAARRLAASDAASTASDSQGAGSDEVGRSSGGSTGSSGVPSPLRVLVVGDSTGLLFGFGMNTWGQADGRAVVYDAAFLSCPVAPGGIDRRHVDDAPVPITDYCNSLPGLWPKAIASFDPDVIIVMSGASNTSERELDGDTRFRTLGDPVWDAYFWKEMNARTDTLERAGVPILWFDMPLLQRDGGAAYGRFDDSSRPERIARYNEFIARLDAERPSVTRFPWAERFNAMSTAEFMRWTPDGVHVDAENMPALLDAWLWPELKHFYREGKQALAAAGSSHARSS